MARRTAQTVNEANLVVMSDIQELKRFTKIDTYGEWGMNSLHESFAAALTYMSRDDGFKSRVRRLATRIRLATQSGQSIESLTLEPYGTGGLPESGNLGTKAGTKDEKAWEQSFGKFWAEQIAEEQAKHPDRNEHLVAENTYSDAATDYGSAVATRLARLRLDADELGRAIENAGAGGRQGARDVAERLINLSADMVHENTDRLRMSVMSRTAVNAVNPSAPDWTDDDRAAEREMVRRAEAARANAAMDVDVEVPLIEWHEGPKHPVPPPARAPSPPLEAAQAPNVAGGAVVPYEPPKAIDIPPSHPSVKEGTMDFSARAERKAKADKARREKALAGSRAATPNMTGKEMTKLIKLLRDHLAAEFGRDLTEAEYKMVDLMVRSAGAQSRQAQQTIDIIMASFREKESRRKAGEPPTPPAPFSHEIKGPEGESMIVDFGTQPAYPSTGPLVPYRQEVARVREPPTAVVVAAPPPPPVVFAPQPVRTPPIPAPPDASVQYKRGDLFNGATKNLPHARRDVWSCVHPALQDRIGGSLYRHVEGNPTNAYERDPTRGNRTVVPTAPGEFKMPGFRSLYDLRL